MNPVDPLLVTLLDLLYELREANVPILLGGGYGLYLRQQRVEAGGEVLFFPAAPPLRATNDLDVFLQTELLTDSERLRPLREALDRLGFTVIPSAQNYQFARKFALGGRDWDIKVDLLARTPDVTQFPHLKMDVRRIKPQPSVGLHAHRTDEAVAIEDTMTVLPVTGVRSNGEAYEGQIFLPSTYALLLMKLYALRDQWQREDKGFGRKHAIDLYTLVALMTEAEYEASRTLSRRYRDTSEGREAARIVSELFTAESGGGVLRIKEHGTLPANAEIAAFLEVLKEFFPT